MATERRSAKRGQFNTQACPGDFLLNVNGQDIDVLDVIDASIAGIGLMIGVFLDPGRTVTLTYKDDTSQLATTGTVTWCRQFPEQGYRIGVVFDFPHHEENNRFLVMAKKYIEAS